MASYILPDVDREGPFSAEDRIMHTSKYAERSFGVALGDIGTVEMRGQMAVLVVTVDGIPHELRWARQPNGGIFWFADGDERPLPAGPSSRALAAMRSALANR